MYSKLLIIADKEQMIKIKSKSLVVGQPVAPELRDHVAMLIEKEQEQMREKLERQEQKQARVQAIQKEFVEWADRKESQIRDKLEKSSKNKTDHLNKIVKKCKDHDKFLNEKYKNFISKKKVNIKEAWKKAEQMGREIENYQHSKMLKEYSLQHNRSQQGTESRFIDRKQLPGDKALHKEYISLSYNNGSKYYNNSKEYWAEINQSMKQSNRLHKAETMPEKDEDFRQQHKNPDQKQRQIIARFKQNIKEQEEIKIQQLGQRLKKIEKSRMKRVELCKKKKSDKGQQYYEPEHNTEKQYKKPKNERSQRMHSQTMFREKRARDWSQYNRHKRQLGLQMHYQHGTEYLQHQKIRHLKTTLAKQIAGSAIEKKLYFERLNH